MLCTLCRFAFNTAAGYYRRFFPLQKAIRLLMSSQPFDPKSTDEWSAYWRDGRGAACRADDAGLYRGVIGDFWREHFGQFDDGCRILDLATGNGAVLELASEVAQRQGKRFLLYGVDLAAISPLKFTKMHEVAPVLNFYPGVGNESLPFARRMFETVTSQYGLEYGGLRSSLGEVSRVLKPGGKLAVVCHWREGDIARESAAEVADIEFFEHLKLPRLMRTLIQRQWQGDAYIKNSHQAMAGSAERGALEHGLNLAFQRLRERRHKPESNLHLFLKNLAHLYQYREAHPLPLVLEKLDLCDAELLFHRKRLQALVRAALTPQRLKYFLELLEGAGFVALDHGLVVEAADGKHIGYQVQARRLQE